jgi:hypothetical protein
VGKASRRKHGHKRGGQSSITPSPWVSSVWAKRSAELLEHLAIPHPALLSVMVTATLRYAREVKELGMDNDNEAKVQLASLSLGSGMNTEDWLAEMTKLTEEMAQVRQLTPEIHAQLLKQMHRLIHHGEAYPSHAEAYIIAPEMHNVVMAASMTVTRDDLFTVDPETDPPTPAGLFLLPTPCGSGRGAFAPVSAIGWRPQSGRILSHSQHKMGIWLEGWSLRQDIDTRSMWAFAVQASRRAGVPAPRALPFSHDWLFNGNSLTVPEKGALRYAEQLAHKIEESKNADSAEKVIQNPSKKLGGLFNASLITARRVG